VIVVGRSVEGRAISAIHFPGPAPTILLHAAIHGDEPLGVHCLAELAAELRRVPTLPRAICLVPVVNPDGLAAGRKQNARNVDLNRNYPAASWRREHEPHYDPGEAPASEPETRALMEVIAKSGATRLIALHSPFRTVNYDGPARALAERMAAANGYGATHDIGYPTPGSFGAYYGVDLGLEVITLEIPPMSEADAWRENRGALRIACDLDPLAPV